MPSLRQRVLDAAGVDDAWERPRPEIGRQDVVLAVTIGLLGLLSLELVRSSGGLDRTDAPVWAQWLVALSGALLLLGRRRWPLVVAILAAGHMFVAGVAMPQVMGQLASQIVYFVAILSGVAWARDRKAMLLVVTLSPSVDAGDDLAAAERADPGGWHGAPRHWAAPE